VKRSMYSKIKILGHPICPMWVAYPIALHTFTLVAYIFHAANIRHAGIVQDHRRPARPFPGVEATQEGGFLPW
jgi:hypothetical protein